MADKRFVLIRKDMGALNVIVDTETGVEYGISDGLSNYFIPLINADGTPKVNKDYLNKEN